MYAERSFQYLITRPIRCYRISEVMALAHHNSEVGIKRYSLVAVVVGQQVRRWRSIVICIASWGRKVVWSCVLALWVWLRVRLLSSAWSGCSTYHCNMEVRKPFPSLCSTHTQAEKIETLKAARAVRMRCCSGGIIGMGESREQRVEFALFLML